MNWPPASSTGRPPPPPGRFRSFLVRGDTDFTQTKHLDRWMMPATSASSLVSMPDPIWWPWPSNCRTQRTASWSGRPSDQDRAAAATPTHKARIVQERASRPFTRSRRCCRVRLPASGLRPDYRLIVLRKKLAIEKRGVRSVRSTATSSSSPFIAICCRSGRADSGGRCYQENL